MTSLLDTNCVVFTDSTYVGQGPLGEVARAAKKVFDDDKLASLMIFDNVTSERLEIDFRGNAEDVINRLKSETQSIDQSTSETSDEPAHASGPGRPRLGVIAREVTLLPRHWEWLNSQPGSASVAIRKLVEEARVKNTDIDRIRIAKESCYRFISTMAGDLTGFEEATRALFAGNRDGFAHNVSAWPDDIRQHALALAGRAWS